MLSLTPPDAEYGNHTSTRNYRQPIHIQASRSHYGPLLLGGVEVFEYKGAFIHAKTIVVDGLWATIGSTNIDNRSFALNQEINLTVHDSAVARHLEEIFREDLKYSEPVTYEQWRSRGIFEQLFEFFSFPMNEQL